MKNSQTFLGNTFPFPKTVLLDLCTVIFWPINSLFPLSAVCLQIRLIVHWLLVNFIPQSRVIPFRTFGYVIITLSDARPRVLALIEMCCFAAVASFFLIVFEWAFLFSGVLYFYFLWIAQPHSLYSDCQKLWNICGEIATLKPLK